MGLARGIWRGLGGMLAALVGLVIGLGLSLAEAQGAKDPAAVLAKRLKVNPQAVLEDAAQAIAAADGRLDAAGVARVVALRRAALRAEALGRWLAADLDNDGAISAKEGAAYLPVLSARARAGLGLALAQADGNGDGTVDGAELRAAADRLAEAGFDDRDAADLSALLTLDRDGDWALTLPEALAATGG